MTQRDIDRFWSKVQRGDGCWEWTSTLNTKGYGVMQVANRQKYAHRLSYELAKGDIGGLTIDHLCRNRKCVRPDHLEAVSAVENVMRGTGFAPTRAAATHCSKGHEFTPENT